MNIVEARRRLLALTGRSEFGELGDAQIVDLLKRLQREAHRQACLRCGRFSGDLIHDNGNDHGGTGTATMHPFIGEPEKYLLQWAAIEVHLRTRSRPKGGAPTDEMVKWNQAIAEAKAAVEAMFAPIPLEDIDRHDKYFSKEYAALPALDVQETK